MMTHYQTEIMRIRKRVYANQVQLDVVIGMKKYIDYNYEQDLNLNLLSEVRFVSKFHLLRLFKRYYGQTPRQYLTERRIEASKVLLKKGLAVANVCYAVGFESPASFATLFKSRTGQTPGAFKKAQFSQRDLHLHLESLLP
ncbi:AraC-like DNA-binding protein [Pedobacter sp. AK017]|uniref:helix-turn-helix domain-containing protein n=1 Tax=Pedobacter sp. AK017 TaxID=2723073 RepID=UPI0016071D76|nr:AraC family transcriptional regulator [Pedobacter sp. AK017]MBB5438333.1 AraC-like DNA-binding protein [Pedobacter sp. AK017]